MPELTMYVISEINRRGPPGQLDDAGLWRQHIDIVDRDKNARIAN
jgi:hypothetical protein